MQAVPHIIHKRELKRYRRQRNTAGIWALGCALLLSLGASLVVIMSGLIYTNLTKGLPSVASLSSLLDPPKGILREPTRLYDRTGVHVLLTLQNPAAEDSQYLTLDSSKDNFLPTSLISATIATADPTFWQNPGFSLEGIPQNTHPTLAQQLVSDLLLWEEPASLRRALRERLLAAQITSHYGREQVLTWYLNNSNYGRLAYGADAASRVYFGKPASELSIAEAAMLAAVAQAPALNPLDSKQAAMENQHKVLNTMLSRGVISTEQFKKAEKEILKINSAVPSEEKIAPAFVNLVIEQLGNRIELERLERGGLRVITTLDYDLQLQSACAAASQLARMTDQADVATTAEGGECLASRLLPTIQQGGALPKDSLAANVIVYDPKRGEVLSMVGEPAPGLNPAQVSGRPGGTLLTPFLYLTAFTRGLSPATLLWDTPEENAPGEATENPKQQFQGPVRLRTAMANDILVPAAKLLAKVGAENVLETARQLGINLDSKGEDFITSLLDDSNNSLLDFSQAYGVLANEGVLAGETLPSGNGSSEEPILQPVTILSVEDSQGKIWWGTSSSATEKPVSLRPVITPQLAYLVTDVLKDEPARWLSLRHPNPLEIGRPVAAKIGQTMDQHDSWTIGYTPQLLVATWVGNRQANQGQDEVQVVPSGSAAALWHAVIQDASRDLPPDDWPMPAGMSRMAVCNPSGMLPSTDCPDVVSEVFLNGTEPTQVDNLYKKMQINRETGRLATAFTPPDLIEDRTYLLVPPEAHEWARLTALPIPPVDYDIILSREESSPDVKIASPEMLAQVRGEVPILGSASGDDFAYYRLQYGKGLNPQQWFQIGQDHDTPVEEGKLGTWETESLDGLYTLQLQVVRQDKRVDSALAQITIDNQPPEIKIVNPIAGQEAILKDGLLIILVEASDNLAVKSVTFYIDGDLIDLRNDLPYAIPWKASPGKHTLRVVATDEAGNKNETETEFETK